MAICPHINLSKPAKFKREHGIYLVMSTPKCTHSPENQHTGNNPEVMGGISTVDLGFWHEIESPVISGKMSKGSGIKELSTDLSSAPGKEVWAEEARLEKHPGCRGIARLGCPSTALESLTLC